VRFPPYPEAIRAGEEELCRIRSGAQNWDIVEAVAHLSIVMMESYALKELSEAEMRRVEKHVARCPKCRDHLDEELGWAAAMRSPFKRYVEKLIEAERKKAKR
jgi:anti-sigma factor RsiW